MHSLFLSRSLSFILSLSRSLCSSSFSSFKTLDTSPSVTLSPSRSIFFFIASLSLSFFPFLSLSLSVSLLLSSSLSHVFTLTLTLLLSLDQQLPSQPALVQHPKWAPSCNSCSFNLFSTSDSLLPSILLSRSLTMLLSHAHLLSSPLTCASLPCSLSFVLSLSLSCSLCSSPLSLSLSSSLVLHSPISRSQSRLQSLTLCSHYLTPSFLLFHSNFDSSSPLLLVSHSMCSLVLTFGFTHANSLDLTHFLSQFLSSSLTLFFFFFSLSLASFSLSLLLTSSPLFIAKLACTSNPFLACSFSNPLTI